MILKVNGQTITDGGTVSVSKLDKQTVALFWEDPEQSITLFVNGKPADPAVKNGLINRADASSGTFNLIAGANRLSYILYKKADNLNNFGGKAINFIVVVKPEAEPTTPTPGRSVVRGTIIESSKAEVAALAKDCGFTLWRDWCSVNWSTGQINDSKDIANVNAKVKQGWQVILTVTPDEKKNRKGDKCKDFSIVADQIIAQGLDKSVIVQLVNEANLDSYWPNGDVWDATKSFAVPVGIKLKAAGYKLACPSITWGTPKTIVEWVDGIFARSPSALWDYIDGHLYLPSMGDYERVAQAYKALADKHNVVAMSSEWNRKEGVEAFASNASKYFAVMDKYFAIHCFFSFAFGEKFNPLNPYCYRDGKTNAVYDAIKKVLKG